MESCWQFVPYDKLNQFHHELPSPDSKPPALIHLRLTGTAIRAAPPPTWNLGSFLDRGKKAAEVEAPPALITSGKEKKCVTRFFKAEDKEKGRSLHSE